MEDKGWNGEQTAECTAWKAAWKEASATRQSSSEFGRFRHPEKADVSEMIIDEVEASEGGIKDMIERLQGSGKQWGLVEGEGGIKDMIERLW